MAFPNMNLLVLYLVFLNTFTFFRYDNLTNDFISFEYLDHLITSDPTISIGISFVKLFIKFLMALCLPTSSGQTEHCSCKKYVIQSIYYLVIWIKNVISKVLLLFIKFTFCRYIQSIVLQEVMNFVSWHSYGWYKLQDFRKALESFLQTRSRFLSKLFASSLLASF